MLAELGYGKNGRKPTAQTVGDFLYRLPQFRERLGRYIPGDDGRIQGKLDELLAEDRSLARRYHLKRSPAGG